jgi:hypothetical protein
MKTFENRLSLTRDDPKEEMKSPKNQRAGANDNGSGSLRNNGDSYGVTDGGEE